MIWSLHPDAHPRLAEMDALTVVYHAASGETHLLGEAVLAVIQRLSDGPADAEALRRASGLPDEQLAAELTALEAVGLIVPA